MDKNRKCPICGGEFEEGFITDSGYLGTPVSQQQGWMAGKGGTFTIGGDQIKIKTFKCKKCGYLESYAK